MTSPRKTSKSSFRVLKGNDIKAVAEYIKSKDCRNIIVMLGAGVSTSAGIPDFRSPKTGLYANLARLNLPYPEAVFEIGFFRQNPVPFYTLAQELYPGKYRPTLTHSFIRLLASKRLLQTCFTQNIDTLERRAGVPDHKIIEAHGSFASQRCIDCHTPYDGLKMKENIRNKEIAFCEKCRGLVKPDIVFFGESLPDKFIHAIPSVKMADLLLIIGTSLTVHPFASLAGLAEPLCPRVLVNLEKVGDLGRRPDDVLLLGKCDEVVRDLCRELGWEEELMSFWEETRPDEDTKPKENIIDNEAELETKVDDLVSKIGTALVLDQGQGKLKNEPKTEDKDKDKDKPTGEAETKIVQGEKLPVGAVPTPEDNPVSKVAVDSSLRSDLPANQSSSRLENALENL
ncbi:class I sirtuins SIR2 family protein [Desarmillaria ectypa]|nr:class I sirtuins SIR2 family protein [Desarmillaria ectypa]